MKIMMGWHLLCSRASLSWITGPQFPAAQTHSAGFGSPSRAAAHKLGRVGQVLS